MRDRDDIDMQAWARRAFEGEPAAGSLGDTTRADLDRAHAGLSRRRRWTAGFSAVAVAGVVTAIAMGPTLVPDGGTDSRPTDFADQPKSPTPDRPKPAGERPDRPGDGYPYYEQRHLLYVVAKDHLDPAGEHLSMHQNVLSGGTTDSQHIGTKLNWKIRGEPGLGMVQVAIATPGMTDADRRFEIGCGEYFSCEQRELDDGSTAWIGQSGDGLIGVAYEQADGESVWVLIDPLFGNNSLTPVSEVDVDVNDVLGFVADDRLRFIDSGMVMTWDGRLVPEGCPRGDGDGLVYPDDPPPDEVPSDCPSPKPRD